MPGNSISQPMARCPARTAMKTSLKERSTRTLYTLPRTGGIFLVWSNVSPAMTRFWRAWGKAPTDPKGSKNPENTSPVFNVTAHITNPGSEKTGWHTSILIDLGTNNVGPVTRSDLSCPPCPLKMRPV